MAISAKEVQALREKTGVGMMECKKALVETNGDMDKAIEYLREKGLAASIKKGDRIAAEGAAYATVIDGVGVVVEVNAETDFVGKNEKFVDFVHRREHQGPPLCPVRRWRQRGICSCRRQDWRAGEFRDRSLCRQGGGYW